MKKPSLALAAAAMMTVGLAFAPAAGADTVLLCGHVGHVVSTPALGAIPDQAAIAQCFIVPN